MSTQQGPEQPAVVRIDLTDEQKRRVAEAFGEARLATTEMAIELTAEELERRIVPRIFTN